jgi:GST-like protein
MAGQNHYFVQYALQQLPYAIDRYVKETSRLFGVLNQHLSDGRAFICGDISIADMAAHEMAKSVNTAPTVDQNAKSIYLAKTPKQSFC